MRLRFPAGRDWWASEFLAFSACVLPALGMTIAADDFPTKGFE
jgi:hypothetical protein